MRHIIEWVRDFIVLHNVLIGSTFPQEWIEPNAEDLDDDVNIVYVKLNLTRVKHLKFSSEVRPKEWKEQTLSP